jgi:hypothetical protein
MSFYEDREEEGEENVEVKEEKRRNVFLSKSIRFQTFFFFNVYLSFLLYYLT